MERGIEGLLYSVGLETWKEEAWDMEVKLSL